MQSSSKTWKVFNNGGERCVCPAEFVFASTHGQLQPLPSPWFTKMVCNKAGFQKLRPNGYCRMTEPLLQTTFGKLRLRHHQVFPQNLIDSRLKNQPEQHHSHVLPAAVAAVMFSCSVVVCPTSKTICTKADFSVCASIDMHV